MVPALPPVPIPFLDETEASEGTLWPLASPRDREHQPGAMGGRRGQDWRTEPRLCLVLSPHLAPRAEGPQEQQLLLFPFPRTAHSSGPGLHARCPLCLPDSALLILTHSSDLGRCHFPWEAFPDPDQVSLPPSAPPPQLQALTGFPCTSHASACSLYIHLWDGFLSTRPLH